MDPGLLIQGHIEVAHPAHKYRHVAHRLHTLDGLLAQEKSFISRAVVQLIIKVWEKAALAIFLNGIGDTRDEVSQGLLFDGRKHQVARSLASSKGIHSPAYRNEIFGGHRLSPGLLKHGTTHGIGITAAVLGLNLHTP